MKIVRKKVCLLGGFAVGKTSLVRRFVEDRFDDRYLSTVGVKVSRKSVTLPEVEVGMMLWDISGRPDFEHLRPRYLKGTAGALLVCDLTRPETMSLLTDEVNALRTHSPKSPILIAGNKCDLWGKAEPPEMLTSLANDLQAQVMMTSALSGWGVEDAFSALAATLV